MAGTASDYLENLTITNCLKNSVKYLALFTVNPSFETGSGGTEPTGVASYVRKQIDFNVASGGATANTSAIEWTVGTDVGAATYTGWGVYDQLAAGGNLIFGDQFGTNRTLVNTGDKLSFASGAITYATT